MRQGESKHGLWRKQPSEADSNATQVLQPPDRIQRDRVNYRANVPEKKVETGDFSRETEATEIIKCARNRK